MWRPGGSPDEVHHYALRGDTFLYWLLVPYAEDCSVAPSDPPANQLLVEEWKMRLLVHPMSGHVYGGVLKNELLGEFPSFIDDCDLHVIKEEQHHVARPGDAYVIWWKGVVDAVVTLDGVATCYRK